MHVRGLGSRCPPDVAKIPGPKERMFQLLRLETSIGSYSERKHVLADSCCLLENELIFDKDAIACHRVRYHKLPILFSVIALRDRTAVVRVNQLDVPRKNHRCVLLCHMSCIYLHGTERHGG